MDEDGHRYFFGSHSEMPWKVVGPRAPGIVDVAQADAKDGRVGEVRMNEKIKAVEVRAELRQIKTMADGSVNIVLNLPEDCMDQIKILLDWLGLELKAVIVCE